MGSVASAAMVTPGLWKSDQRTLVNGKDAQVVLEQLNKQMLLGLPKGLGNQATVTMNTAKTLGTTTVCVTPQIGVTMMSPAMIFGTFARMNPTCRLVPGTPTGATVPFTGRCDDPTSFTGNVQGVLTVESASSWKTDVTGYGRFPDVMLTAMSLPAKSMVNVQATSANRWVASACTAK
jgi:hypothetical protein